MRAGLRRFAVLYLSIAAVTAAVALVIGTAFGASADRSITIGLYLVGAFLLMAGFFTGNRGPVRPRSGAVPIIGPRFVRWATPEEREESINSSALYVFLGFALIVLGIVADTRYSLF